MKKHVIWLLVVALVMTTAVAIAANEPASNPGTVNTISSQTLPQFQGGGCTIGTWTPVANLNTARSRPSTSYSPATGNFYAVGGESTGGNRNIPIEEYDVGANTWTNRANLLTGVSNTGSAGVGNYVYVPGGYDGVGAVSAMQRFDPVANTVTTVAPMPAGNYAHAVAALGTDIYVLGGSSTGASGITNYIYDTVADSWSTGAAVPVATQYPAAASDGTYIYVLGGGTTNIANVQRYDPVADSWTALPNMTTGRGGPGAFFDGQNVWAIAGGWSTYLTSTEYWDGAAWNAGPPVNVGVRTLGAAFANGIGLKAGGWAGAYSDAAETIAIDCGQGIEISKSPAYQDVLVNGTADFTITVTNTSGAPLDNVTVSDAMVPACDNSLGTLAAGASSSYNCSDVGVTASYTNTAVVSSTLNQEPGPSASDDAIVMVWDAALDIEKAPDLQVVASGGTANFTITVTNSGTVDLISVTVSDAMVPACDAVIGPLAAGASNSYTCSDVGVTAEYTNTAVVTGSIDAGLPVPTAMDDAYVALPPTGVSLVDFGSGSAALSPLWLAAILGLIAGFGLLIRRRFVN